MFFLLATKQMPRLSWSQPCCYPSWHILWVSSCCSIAQSCLTLCDPMDCITPGFPVHHQLPELAQTCVHQVGDAPKWGTAIKKELKHVRMPLKPEVSGTRMDAEKEMKTQWASWHCTQKPDGPWRCCRCQLLGKRRNWHWNMGGRGSCNEAAESKSMRGITYQKNLKRKWKGSRSVVSDSLLPHGLLPTRLLRPWHFPGKSTGVGCHCLLCCTP